MTLTSIIIGVVFVVISLMIAGEVGYRYHRNHVLKNAWRSRRLFDGWKYVDDVAPDKTGIVRDRPDSGPVLMGMAFLEKGIFLKYKSPFPSPFRHSFALFFPWQAIKEYRPIKLPPMFYVSNLIKKEDAYFELALRKTEMTLILPEKYLQEIASHLPSMRLEFF